MRIISFFILAAAFYQLIGCVSEPSLMPAKKQIKDVPLQARKEDSAPRKRIVVLPFLDTSETRPQSLRDQARSTFIKELNNTGQFIAVDSSDLKLEPDKQIKDGNYLFPEISKAAASLGVSVLLEGKIMDIKVSRKADPVGIFRQMKTRFEASVRVRMATARSGKEFYNTVKTVTLEEAQTRVGENVTADKMLKTNPELVERLITDAFLDFINQLALAMDKITWEGRIAMINGERIFLNVGRISGLQVGDILKVSEEGEEVYDPQTGNYIGKSYGRMKGTVEVISYFGQDGAIALVHSGAGFKENDKIELY
jgi:hypothetical protein